MVNGLFMILDIQKKPFYCGLYQYCFFLLGGAIIYLRIYKSKKT